jgi:hypothetical protein
VGIQVDEKDETKLNDWIVSPRDELPPSKFPPRPPYGRDSIRVPCQFRKLLKYYPNKACILPASYLTDTIIFYFDKMRADDHAICKG